MKIVYETGFFTDVKNLFSAPLKRLVIFPVSGNNTFEASEFTDPRFSL